MAFLLSSNDQFVWRKTRSTSWSRSSRAPSRGTGEKDKHLLSVKEWYSLSVPHGIPCLELVKKEASFLCCFGQQDVKELFSILFSFQGRKV